ncbi:hypothetical protein ENSA5_36290 [Enhygromyxa salina]|uniref:Uncharacterized protein n=1 Tax=Enhygromyxa salina TaxID=215803 RepID=A0A2S9XUN3_9BACT|nr:hypothetical protein [Enhygromyxa salina]PRP96553.1 hypothetical protein ENSA5_36290 [Enhygromyxa salina]
MRRRSTLALTLSLVGALAGLGACKSEGDQKKRRSAPLEREEVPAGTRADIQEVEAQSYARSLVEQLDLIPPDADGYLVIRDLRPLIAQGRRVEQVMAGPLARAIPALAKLGGGSGDGRLAQLERARELLALVLAGLESTGVRLDQGAVVVLGEGEPLVLFAAEDLARLGALAAVIGDSGELAQGCGALIERPGWYACSLGGAEALGRYVPAKQGEALAARLGDRLGGVELERINVALSLAEVGGSVDAILRTDPGLWELTLPLPASEGPGEQLLAVGPAPALRALVPGTSFMWARLDPAALGSGAAPAGPVSPEILTGELWFGALDEPKGMTAQAGVNDVSAAASAIGTLARMLPPDAVEPEQLPGLRVEFDRASIDLDGKLVPSIGVSVGGEGAQAWANTLGLDPRVRLWAYGDYLSAALGEVQAIPAALARLEGGGPSPAAIAGLAPTLAGALLGGEVGLVMHVVLDHWQAPPSEAELQALLAGVPEARRPSSTAITAAFEALAPWSTVDLWLSRRASAEGSQSKWLAHLSLVPFGAEGGGVDAAEVELAAEVLDAVLAGGDGQAGYRRLLSRFPDSARASSYRARVGDAPEHHAAVGMVELGVVGALVLPAFTGYLAEAKTTEATAQTQTILAAALRAREAAGSCEPLLGKAGPTPPLAVLCHEGAGGRCRAVADPSAGEGHYPRSAWTEDPLWKAIAYAPDDALGHRFHYSIEVELDGAQGCRITVQAVGDLDGDGVYSTYERVATVAADGSQTLAPLGIDQGQE